MFNDFAKKARAGDAVLLYQHESQHHLLARWHAGQRREAADNIVPVRTGIRHEGAFCQRFP